MLKRLLLSCFILISIISQSFSQATDTARSAPKENVLAKNHSPKKAAAMSAIFPGFGQIYNKKYWKLPIIYGGFAGLAYSFDYNQTRYVKYRDAYKYRIDGDATTVDDYTNLYSEKTLFDAQQYYHRYRDISLIGMGLLYILNIIDASVDAHLFTFDVSDDLSFRLSPNYIYTTTNTIQPGLSININF